MELKGIKHSRSAILPDSGKGVMLLAGPSETGLEVQGSEPCCFATPSYSSVYSRDHLLPAGEHLAVFRQYWNKTQLPVGKHVPFKVTGGDKELFKFHFHFY